MSESESPGPAWRVAREALGLSVSEVATRLKVPNVVIENIEADRLDALPVKVFARAHIRSYAALVGLDADEMVSDYDRKTDHEENAENGSRPLGTLPAVWVAFRKGPRRLRMQSWVFGGTVVLFAALAGIFLWFVWLSEAPMTSAPVEQPSQVANDDEAAPVSSAAGGPYASFTSPGAPVQLNGLLAPDGLIEQDEAGDPDVEGDAISDGSPNGPPNAPADAPPDAPPEGLSEIQKELGALSNPLTYSPGDEHVLVFHFSSDCWVEVFDAAGGLLHQNLERTGNRLEVRGDAPFRITLGYAPGAQLEYNGDPVVLAPHTHNDVARLVLGL